LRACYISPPPPALACLLASATKNKRKIFFLLAFGFVSDILSKYFPLIWVYRGYLVIKKKKLKPCSIKTQINKRNKAKPRTRLCARLGKSPPIKKGDFFFDSYIK